ncbi:hypothetical protein [Shinella sumterensis]|uniref:Uncharacterized protein n=1 Tax=Shinella sumterensis TaxID=1967501 RepID=A0AA50CK71_9HYPH|nr:hypothetical protein [Shinella sumterensis]WLR98370.1 hypothetical protein Q9313_04880 [Shinella sumterensis]
MTEEKKVRIMPKGGRKGGAVFPRIALDDALVYAKKLVSKTHVGPQPRDIIYTGVVGAKGGTGDVKISALKQYGFLKGGNKENYSADDLAKRINFAPENEILPLLREAALRPVIFKRIFDAYHGDEISRSKLRQRAADLNVHPDEADTCADLYIATMATAKLVVIEGDRICHVSSIDLLPVVDGIESVGVQKNLNGISDNSFDVAINEEDALQETNAVIEGVGKFSMVPDQNASLKPRSIFNVNINLDASMDVEKLQKQLELLRRYGAI